MDIYTIGFTKKDAKTFFDFIKNSDIKTVLDVRLNNISQLSGFAKKDDLAFFLKELCGSDYLHVPEFTPTKEMLDSYKKKEISWQQYEDDFLELMDKRSIHKHLSPELLDRGCLLCSEHEPHFCHRRLVVEFINLNSDYNLTVNHLY